MDSDRYNDTDSTGCVDVKRTAELANILRNTRRIQILIELDSADEDGMTVGELADRIAEREHGPQFSPEARKAVYVATYQSHAPKLDAWNVIDLQRDTATRGSRFEEVISTLDRLQV
jgi:hypothetical protein